MRFSHVLTGLALLGAGAVLALVLRPQHTLKPFQVTGDPPITVSDGSLHAHSKNGWVKDGMDGDTTIQAKPANGSLVNRCGMKDSAGNDTAVSLWADDKIYDIAPGATVTITHDPAAAGSDALSAVNISVPNGTGPLIISTVRGDFSKGNGKKYNREHSRVGEVKQIVISNPSSTWTPVNPNNPHFSFLACYQ